MSTTWNSIHMIRMRKCPNLPAQSKTTKKYTTKLSLKVIKLNMNKAEKEKRQKRLNLGE